MSGSIDLSVILPAFNEGAALEEATARYVAALRPRAAAFELVVIDDGSTDDTWTWAQHAERAYPEVRALRNERNAGQVASLLRGFGVARGRLVTHNGVDLPLDPGDTPALIDLHDQGADVVVVERTHREAYGWFRKLTSWGHVFLVRTFLGSPFVDHNFVQSFRREVLRSIPVETAGVTTVTTELILKSHARGLDVRSLRLPYHSRRSGRSSITAAKIAHTGRELLRLRGALVRWRQNE